MQKLVTVWLGSPGSAVNEHLNEYLGDGWRVKSMVGVGMAAAENELANGFLAVLLEKKEDA
jgi:hypothetical protein